MSEASGATGGRTQGRVGQVINGKWQIEARIGAGGMSTVYSAVHRNGTRAALKLLNLQLSREESIRARFLREGYVANSVAHPGVCRVLDDGYSEDGCAYLVLELLEGETMEERRLRLGGAMPIDEVLEIAEQALDTLAAAHDKGIVHRDVKPENVFLTTSGQAKLLDFGLARMRDAGIEATATGITIGTPEFMPPEQALGKSDVDARSDVWGVGAMIFTAVSGQYVHEAQSLHEQLVASATRRARSVLTVAPQVSRAVAKVVDRALELEQGDRWASAGEMRRALREARQESLPTFQSVTVRADFVGGSAVPSPPSAPISSDRTVAMSNPLPPSSDGPTLESAVQARPPIQYMTERLPPKALLGAQMTMQMQPSHHSSARVSTAPAPPPPPVPQGSQPPLPPPHHVSSGAMPIAHPHVSPQHQSGAHVYAPHGPHGPHASAEPAPKGRGAIIASAVLLVAVLATAIYLYVHGMPHLP